MTPLRPEPTPATPDEDLRWFEAQLDLIGADQSRWPDPGRAHRILTETPAAAELLAAAEAVDSLLDMSPAPEPSAALKGRILLDAERVTQPVQPRRFSATRMLASIGEILRTFAPPAAVAASVLALGLWVGYDGSMMPAGLSGALLGSDGVDSMAFAVPELAEAL